MEENFIEGEEETVCANLFNENLFNAVRSVGALLEIDSAGKSRRANAFLTH